MPAIGHCKLCRSPYAPGLNKLLLDGKNSTQIRDAMAPLGLVFTRKTLATHKQHITHPLLTAVEHARKKPVIMPQSNKAVLEAIRDLGMRNAIDNPESVTVDHAIKAASVLESKDTKGDNILVIMAKAVMQDVSDDVKGYIDGEYKELTGGTVDSHFTEPA